MTPTPPQRFCAHCGHGFEPQRPTQYHCTTACATAEREAETIHAQLEAPPIDVEKTPLAQWLRKTYGNTDWGY